MGIRMDQHRGLNQWARELVKGCDLPHFSGKYKTREVVFPNGKMGTIEVPVMESCVIREESEDFYMGINGHLYPLFHYIFRHGYMAGRVLTEYVQAAPWYSGPVFFLALLDEEGKPVPESLWREEYIENL